MALSQKTQRDLIFIMILLSVLGGVLFWLLTIIGVFGSSPQSHPPAPAPQALTATSTTQPIPTMSTQPSTSQAAVPAADQRSAAMHYHASGLRDPFKSYLPERWQKVVPPPPAVRNPEPPLLPSPPRAPTLQFNIEGLLWGGPEPQVIIDHEVYGIGDVVQGATITAIGPEGVQMELQGQILRMGIKVGVEESIAPTPSVMRARRGQGHIGPFGGTQ